MENNNPTQILELEHKFILKVIGGIKKIESQITPGDKIAADQLIRIVDFMRNYADRCHHGKEEAILFPYLIEHGVPSEGCPIGALSHEHVAGRKLVLSMSENIAAFQNGDEEAQKQIIEVAQNITKLYHNHIWKEDNLLFPMTHKVCNSQELDELYNLFTTSDDQFGHEAILSYQNFADNI